MAVAAFCAAPAFSATIIPTENTTTVAAGTTLGGITLNDDMDFGKLTSSSLGSFVPVGGNFCAGDYSISLWLDTTSLNTGSATTLFGYLSTKPNSAYGANALVWNADGKLMMADGNLNTSTGAFNSNRGDTSENALSVGDKINITLSSVGASGDNGQNVSVYVNGSLFDTLVYNGNMNNSTSGYLGTWINTDLVWGTIQTNEGALDASQIADFINPAPIPEPATASLSLLGLAALMMRRRRA